MGRNTEKRRDRKRREVRLMKDGKNVEKNVTGIGTRRKRGRKEEGLELMQQRDR